MFKKFIYKDYGLGKEASKGVKEMLNFFLEEKIKKVLDYGCGNGRNTIYLAKNEFLVTAADYTPFINKVSDLLKTIKKEDVQITIQELDENKKVLPFDSNYFDLILAWRILHRGTYAKRMEVIKELRRVLCEGGYILCAVSSNKDIELDAKRREHTEIEERTFRYESKSVINIRHYFTKEEIEEGKAFPGFRILKIDELKEKTGHKDKNYLRYYWRVLAQKI